MKQTVILTEDKLNNIVKKVVIEVINETSRRQKAQAAIMGKNRKVKTLAIISAQNPMGMEASKEYNDNAQRELIENLENGKYRYFVTKGLYGSPEISVIVYNISLKDTIHMCYTFNQESVIFVDMTDGNKISYQYWEGDDHYSKLKKQYEESTIVDATDDKDFYTQISRKFKFRIPFFEDLIRYNSELIECSKLHNNIDELISETLSDNRTGYSKYTNRGRLRHQIRETLNLNK